MSEMVVTGNGTQKVVICDAGQHKAALDELMSLMDGNPLPETPDGQRILALADAIEAYESAHFPIPGPGLTSPGTVV